MTLTADDAFDAMRDALAAELQIVAGLGVTQSFDAAYRALERAGYREVAAFIGTVDGTADVFKTQLLTHGPLPADAATADTNWNGARLTVAAHDINGQLLP